MLKYVAVGFCDPGRVTSERRQEIPDDEFSSLLLFTSMQSFSICLPSWLNPMYRQELAWLALLASLENWSVTPTLHSLHSILIPLIRQTVCGFPSFLYSHRGKNHTDAQLAELIYDLDLSWATYVSSTFRAPSRSQNNKPLCTKYSMLAASSQGPWTWSSTSRLSI